MENSTQARLSTPAEVEARKTGPVLLGAQYILTSVSGINITTNEKKNVINMVSKNDYRFNLRFLTKYSIMFMLAILL